MSAAISPAVVEPPLRIGISALRGVDGRIRDIQRDTQLTGQRKADSLEAAQYHIEQAEKRMREWAKANRIEIRDTMAT